MLKQHLLGLIVCLALSVYPRHQLYGQITNNVLIGHVTDDNGTNLASVRITIQENGEQTTSDKEGNFTLRDLQVGRYNLLATSDGMEDKKIAVTIHDGEKNEVDITLSKGAKQIKGITLTDTKRKTIEKTESEYVARLPIKNIENPQVYISVSEQLMKTQLATDLDAGLKNVVGAGVPIRYNQNRIVFYSRGFTVQPKIRNGLTTFNQNAIDPVGLDRIEVLKGPSATLFGSAEVSYGGLLNRVTKKPYEDFGGTVSYSAGSWNLNRTTLDINSPLNESKTLLFRLNGALHKENSFQDAGFFNTMAVVPSLTYRLSPDTEIHLDLEYTKSKGTSPVRHSPYLKGKLTKREATDFEAQYNHSFASNEVYYTGENIDLFGEIKHRLSENWVSSTSFARTKTLTDGSTSRIYGQSESTFKARIYDGYYGYQSTNVQQNFTGNFEVLGIKNRMVVGANYYNYYQDRDIREVNTAKYNWTSGDFHAQFNRAYIDSARIGDKRTLRTIDQHTYSAYVSDVMNITDEFLVMLSLRYDYFDNKGTTDRLKQQTTGDYEQQALSPKLGLVYQLIPDQLSVFANYMHGFSNEGGSDSNGKSFDPEEAIQMEGGIKFDLFEKKISGSLSYYDIGVKNIVRQDPNNKDFNTQDGEQTSKGIEFEFIASILPQLNLIFGYAYNDSELKNTKGGTQDGLRPTTAGPEHLLNWWADYSVHINHSGKIVFGFGGNSGTESYAVNTKTTRLTIPKYTIMDAGISYQTELLNLGIKVNNLTDKQYWSNRLTPQKPRNIVANLTLNF